MKGKIYVAIIVLFLLIILPYAYAENETNIPFIELAEGLDFISDIIGSYYLLGEANTSNQTNQSTTTVNESNLIPLIGEVTQIDESYYILLGDDSDEEFYDVNLTSIERTQIIVGEPVILRQTIIVTNLQAEASQYNINLWDHVDDILKNALEVSVSIGGELLSEQPFFFTYLEGNQSITYEVSYVFAPVTLTTNCETQTVQDLLPEGAIVTTSTLPMDTIIQQVCTLDLNHKGVFEFVDLVIPLDIDTHTISTVYHVESDQELTIINNTILLTKEVIGG